MTPDFVVHWTFKPLLLAGLLGLAFVYGRAWRQLRRQGDESALAFQPWFFGAGLAGMAVLTASPLDDLGQRALFIARMFEYILLVYVLPSLIWMGIPARWPQRLAEHPQIQKRLHWFNEIVIPSVGFNLIFLIWHLPPFFELALRNPFFNQLQLLLLLAVACLMWLPLLCSYLPLRLTLPRQMFYLITLIFAQVPVFAMLTFSRQPLYLTYITAPRVTQMHAFADQQLGGWMLKTVSAVIFAAAFIRIFLEWNRNSRQIDRDENATAFENFELTKRAEERKG